MPADAPDRWAVVFTDGSIRREALDLLGPTCDVRVLNAYPSEDELATACADADAVLARLGTVTRRVIASAPRLRIVARHGVGVDAVDLDAATEHGVVVTTTGRVNAAAVAEYTFALLLALVRHVVRADASMRAGAWDRDPLVGTELDGMTMGVIGYGAIGRRVARQALGFGMRVLACDPAASVAEPGVTIVSLDELLASSDVVSLHTRVDASTVHLIDAHALARTKPGAWLVNTARGELIDEAALMSALERGTLRGAALDTYAREPLAHDHPLRSMASVLLSPHVAGQTEAALRRVATTAAQCILDELAGRVPAFVYNPDAYRNRGAGWPTR
jgi:D-3-phosphoglycerate dehydrogenase / 2-oxoglutarate reductase